MSLSEKEVSEIKAGYQLAWMQLQNASLIASKYKLDPVTQLELDKAMSTLGNSYNAFIEAVTDPKEESEQTL